MSLTRQGRRTRGSRTGENNEAGLDAWPFTFVLSSVTSRTLETFFLTTTIVKPFYNSSYYYYSF